MQKGRRQPAFTSFAIVMMLAQLMLTAGHVHLSGPYGTHVTRAAAWLRFVHEPRTPPFHGDQDRCDLCWAQLTTGHSLIPPEIALPVPAVFPAAEPDAVLHSLADSVTPAAYRSRAPPPQVIT